MKQRYFTIILLLLAAVVQTAAQALTDRYNRQNPVVMVCHWDNPPYEFLNRTRPALPVRHERVERDQEHLR